MKFFLALLTAIISLSSYTFVGVHADCAGCGLVLNDGSTLISECTGRLAGGETKCTYQKANKGATFICHYKNGNSALMGGSNLACPRKAGRGACRSMCP
ncbi:hypothetical protein PAXRUDRAFT_835608 [Paxillus rubicundulus Ve08.2h10]|uniref:Uncharacterized protein n=1 Tax=Paxillus rubicundulus Ve08.2h10 TaxID=930991 RepID=A0A0D0D643_9AGAM|nr:hypothetical protein PAXRUDRAFT_835608 [Paxillus rubicundulus Ve08.2h10]